MDGIRQLSPLELDALREVANIGAGHAATALSQMTDHKIMINVPAVTIRPVEEVTDLLGDPEAVVAAAMMQIMGDLTGRSMVLFPEVSAQVLCDYLFRRPVGTTTAFAAMEHSGLKEVGNILVSAYMTALSEFLGMMLVPSVPALVIDQVGAVLTTAQTSFGDREMAFCVETAFHVPGEDGGLRGHFLLLPDLPSLRAIFDAVRLPA